MSFFGDMNDEPLIFIFTISNLCCISLFIALISLYKLFLIFYSEFNSFFNLSTLAFYESLAGVIVGFLAGVKVVNFFDLVGLGVALIVCMIFLSS